MSSFLASIFSPSAMAGWPPYALALLVIGLLPAKTRPVGRILCLLLAFLWGWLAYAANPLLATADKWALWAALQAVVLLGFGTFAGKLWFPVRRGAWALAGTALIAGSLLLPLLASFLDLPWMPVFGLPLPLVLFTCGVLFFATGWQAIVALLIPLGWALTGGPDLRNSVELWGLTVALLIGAWFALTPLELRGGDERRPSPGAEYLCAYKARPFFGYGLWGTILITVFLLLSSSGSFLGTSRWDRITTNLALLTVLGIALWLAFTAWESLWFRYVAWGMARAGGRTWAWIRRAWKWGLLLVAATALVFLLVPEKSDAVSDQKISQATRDFVAILRSLEARHFLLLTFSSTVLLWLILLAHEGRKRLVIGTFANHTGDDKLKDWVPGLGPRLQNELARIADLYRVIDEARPPQKSPVIEVTPSVQDVGEILKQTNASSIDFGIFKIPTDFLLQFVSRLVSGPRLTGALYKGENELFLTAEITGGGRLSGNWHVDMSRLTEEERKLPEKEIVYKLVEHLSFRVAAHLVSIGSPRWQAVRCFTEGLRSYRETQRQRKDRSRNLREAERCFIRSLNDDQKFAQCHYNLGVVYRQLEELDSAESAFRCALVENSENYEAYYALAETFTQASNYAKAYWFCEAAIGVDATDARAWDLKAYARRRHLQEFLNPEG
ncbi:MAG TPA: hypothetical protein VLQ45_17765, partial [Thermoanaerobaculia bacterium]|nr:hypothetical protein [Thermoanaerobaculia bacterium]